MFVVSQQPASKYRNVGDALRDPGNATGKGILTVTSHAIRKKRHRYLYVDRQGNIEDSVPYPSSILIDQSVLVDAERALTVPSATTPEIEDLEDQLAWLRIVDTIPGFAMSESTHSGVATARSANSLRCAWNAWMAAEPGLTSRIDIHREYQSRLKSDAIIERETTPFERGYVSLNYLALLHAVKPWSEIRGRKFIQGQHLDAFLKWTTSINTSECGFPGHMGAAISRLLLGRGRASQDAAGLLKLNKRPPFSIPALRGAAQDLMYLTIFDMGAAGALSEPFQAEPYFMTADKPLAHARKTVLLTSFRDEQGRPFMETKDMHDAEFSDRNARRVQDAFESIHEGALGRGAVDMSTQRSNAIKQLEQTLQAEGLIA